MYQNKNESEAVLNEARRLVQLGNFNGPRAELEVSSGVAYGISSASELGHAAIEGVTDMDIEDDRLED